MKSSRFRHLPLLILAVMALTLVGCGTQIPSGHRGVFYAKFGGGTQFGNIYGEGFAWHMPWNSMLVYKTQLLESKETLKVLSSDGATIGMEMSILYYPMASKLDSLQVMIGPNYYNARVAPTVRGVGREVAGQFTPEEIYSTNREEITKQIKERLTVQMAESYIIIQDVLMRDVEIPAKISEAINFKLAADQEAQKMQFTIQKEKLEADRKRIEAKGIADFQKIVSAGITTSLLKWKGIEATQKLAESPNSKIIVIGNGSGDLPIILSGDK